MTLFLAAAALAGCADDEADGSPAPVAGLTSVFERATLPFNVTDRWSHTLVEGAFGILDPQSVFVDVPLPLLEGGAAIDPLEPPQAHLGLFLPDIPGCDWAAAELPQRCQVPVIADAGPYWGESDVPADERGAGRLGEFLITNFVPHGYAVAQVSVMGSGQSNHCFDMFGQAEQMGVHHAVEWLGTQPWSNGNVGLIGRSYDGSTPWMAAAHGSPHLATIVPISGLIGLQELTTWNGASEARVMTFHNVIYGTFGVGGDDIVKDVQHRATCPDWMLALGWGGAGYVTGDHVVEIDGTYWAERDFLHRTLDNYDGSVYLIHGLQDNNVDPHAAWPAQLALYDKGNDVKALWGQWFHSYPDRPGEHGDEDPVTSVRYDWAQDLLEWFDHYLKGTGPQPPLHTEIQQLDGRWRVEEHILPDDAIILDLPLGSGTTIVMPNVPVATQSALFLDLGALSETDEVLLGGMSHVTLTVTPTGPGGQVYVELRDVTANEDFGLSYGIMELRHRSQDAAPPAPGVPIEVTIPFQLFDAALPAGHHLGLMLSGTGNGFLPSPVLAPVEVDLGASTLHLSTLERGAASYFEPPAWDPDVVLGD